MTRGWPLNCKKCILTEKWRLLALSQTAIAVRQGWKSRVVGVGGHCIGHLHLQSSGIFFDFYEFLLMRFCNGNSLQDGPLIVVYIVGSLVERAGAIKYLRKRRDLSI